MLLFAVALCVLWGIPASAVAAPPTATTEAATAISYEEATLKGSVNPEGSATNYYFEYGKTKSYGTKIPASPKSVGSGTSKVLVSNLVTGLGESTTYHFRVVAEGGGETVPGEDASFTTAGFNFSFAEKGSGEGQLSEPFDLALDSKGNVWVSDAGNNRIEEFSQEGKYLSQFGKEGSGKGEFKAPKGIAIDSSDNIWVVDSGNNRVQKLNSKGEWVCEFGKEGTGESELKSPTGIALDSSGRAFVTDTSNNRIQRINPKCAHLTTFGKEGTGNGELKAPEGILVDAKGRIWVADTGNNRIQRFNASTFGFTSKFGAEGGGNSQFKSPVGITNDFQERLWVVDSGNDRAQKFDIEGEFFDKVGEEGTGPGKVIKPTAVVAPAPQKLLILDSGNNRVEAWTVKADPPTATTSVANGIKATAATMRGTINPRGLTTTYWFEYGESTAYGTKIPLTPESVGSGLSNVSVEKIVTGLKEGTTYHFRAVAESSAGSSAGIDRTIKTLKLPQATTEAATAIKATQATLNAKVNPEGLATTYYFDYGTTESYGTKIPVSPESVGSGTSNVPVSQIPTGLNPGTTYHFRVLAESEAGLAAGNDKTFTTLKLPQATTEAATAIKATQATLNAKVNPEGLATTYYFDYGTTESYGTKIPISPESIGSGTEYVPVSQTPTGLSEGTTLHFRVVAENEEGAVFGSDKTFTTLKFPKAITEAATAIKATQATLNGKVNSEGSATSYWFEYGKTTSYGTKIPVSPASVGSGTEYVSVSQTPTSLSAGTTYHFRVVAESEAGKVEGADETLTTLKLLKATTEEATGVKLTQATLNGKVNPEGMATSYWFEYGKTTSYGTKIPVSPTSVGSGTSNVSVSQTPTGLSEGTTYHFRVVGESEVGTVPGADKTFTTGLSFSLVFGFTGSGNGQFHHPAGIAIDAEGDVWVADYENNRVQEFDSEGKYLSQFGEEGEEEGQFFYPASIAIDPEGDVWVADTGNSRLQEFSPEGEYLAQFGEWGSEEGQLAEPEDIAIDAEGNIWIADTYNGRLQEFDQEGSLIEVVGSYGSEPGQLGEPTGIDIGQSGNVWVADRQNQRVSEFNEAGEFVRQFGEEGSGNGQFANPDTIDVDESGTVWVVDEGHNRVEWFDEEGKYLGKFGTSGFSIGQFRFLSPTGIASDAKGNLWVSDSNIFLHRVQKFIR